MDKLQAAMEKTFVPITAKMNSQRHVAALRDAFTLVFPLTMAGSIVVLINYVFLDPNGFVASLLHLDKLIPNLASYQNIFTPVIAGTTNIMAILIYFLVGYQLAQEMKGDKLLCGITSLAVFFILYPSTTALKDGTQVWATTYFGAQGLFVALIFGMISTEILTRLSRIEKLRIKMPEMVPPAVAQSFNLLIPIMIVLAVASLSSFIFKNITAGGIQVVIYNAIQAPMTSLGSSMGTILVFVVVQQFLWILGIHGSNTLSALRQVIFT